ncbi:MAG: hypothetical protein DRR04_11520 [Gammaproteobacteria bacterium]|nr:MAG: hypothetical protein DRQ97_12105 [Gammaproteobacteria bacterium]RLA58176.1 MAG: hypothetical protein DRR04_11520 [Gammaproteobacteria bacterium]HDY83333.1 hypothetical protein [Halieaceae bacterium]
MTWLPLSARANRRLLTRRLRKRHIPAPTWFDIEQRDPLLARFGHRERLKLRILASEILWRKTFSPVRGMILTEAIKAYLATRIAIVIYALETPGRSTALDWLRNWRELIVYPSAFSPHRQPITPIGGNPLGLVLHTDPVEQGETSYQGPLVINWQDARPHALRQIPCQVLIHELAHKLDMLDGSSNGHPPLHASMDQQLWHDTFQAAYIHLNRRVKMGRKPGLNPYAATNPAEFFAVCSEYFFASPGRLHAIYPQVYKQLSLFYRQQPLAGIGGNKSLKGTYAESCE